MGRLDWSPNHVTEGSRVVINDLAIGSSGSEVKRLQKKLLELGYNVGRTGADGKFGQNTLDAVKRYQADNGEDQTGVVATASIDTMGLSSKDTGLSKLGLGITANANIVPVDAEIPKPVRYGLYLAGFAAILFIGYKIKNGGIK